MTTVHSSSGRTRPDAELSDFYPIPVERDTLRAGNVYVDPYGHALVLAGWTTQSDDEPGYLLLVDAQPDGAIARRRFWRGSPLVETDEASGQLELIEHLVELVDQILDVVAGRFHRNPLREVAPHDTSQCLVDHRNPTNPPPTHGHAADDR